MKKFSDKAKVKVPTAPEPEVVNESPEDVLRTRLMGVLDEYLRIRFYGAADPVLSGNSRIDGKGLVVDAIVSMLSGDDGSIKESLLGRVYDRTSSLDDDEFGLYMRELVSRVSDKRLIESRLSDLDLLIGVADRPERVRMMKEAYLERDRLISLSLS